jgi:hypothetical protein
MCSTIKKVEQLANYLSWSQICGESTLKNRIFDRGQNTEKQKNKERSRVHDKLLPADGL